MEKIQKNNFSVNEYIVYPAHGVGKITAVEKEIIAGYDMEVFVILFEQEKMTLRVPVSKTQACGMRSLSNTKTIQSALKTLKGRARIRRTMWSRRAQKYETKINSGNLISIAEVVRDLHRSEDQQEQSYSERQLYEAAIDRMAREVAAVENIDRNTAIEKLSCSLIKAA